MPEPIAWPPDTPDHLRRPIKALCRCDACGRLVKPSEHTTCPASEPESAPAPGREGER